VRQILPRLADRRIITYGFSSGADLSAVDVEPGAWGTRFTVRSSRAGGAGGVGNLGEIHLPMPGRHNVLNALAAVGVGLSLRIAFEDIARAIAGFGGVHRRFEHLGTWQGAAVVDDYAHHPTEVAATLAAARQTFPNGRVLAVFQPHLFSRTLDQAEEFGKALLGADLAVVNDIYASRESPIPGVTGELVADAARRAGHADVLYCPRWQDAPALLAPKAGPGDVLITLGAGDVNRLAKALVEETAP
jgi:UDP-N-acetylmuramate--alanine ligase